MWRCGYPLQTVLPAKPKTPLALTAADEDAEDADAVAVLGDTQQASPAAAYSARSDNADSDTSTEPASREICADDGDRGLHPNHGLLDEDIDPEEL